VFLAFEDILKTGGINCIGTGFLVQLNHVGYLLTARHIAVKSGGDPFLVRLNPRNQDGVNKIAGDEVDLGMDLARNSHT
jgi:hypothetical protein